MVWEWGRRKGGCWELTDGWQQLKKIQEEEKAGVDRKEGDEVSTGGIKYGVSVGTSGSMFSGRVESLSLAGRTWAKDRDGLVSRYKKPWSVWNHRVHTKSTWRAEDSGTPAFRKEWRKAVYKEDRKGMGKEVLHDQGSVISSMPRQWRGLKHEWLINTPKCSSQSSRKGRSEIVPLNLQITTSLMTSVISDFSSLLATQQTNLKCTHITTVLKKSV